jgi:hypothetical protein
MQNDTQKMIEALKTQLASIERQLATQAAQTATQARARSREQAKAEVIAALKATPGGHMSVIDLIAKCKLPKSSAWIWIHELDADAQIFLQVTRRPELTGRKDGRDVTIAWHPDAIATQ